MKSEVIKKHWQTSNGKRIYSNSIDTKPVCFKISKKWAGCIFAALKMNAIQKKTIIPNY